MSRTKKFFDLLDRCERLDRTLRRKLSPAKRRQLHSARNAAWHKLTVDLLDGTRQLDRKKREQLRQALVVLATGEFQWRVSINTYPGLWLTVGASSGQAACERFKAFFGISGFKDPSVLLLDEPNHA